jgi:hypothetical protein
MSKVRFALLSGVILLTSSCLKLNGWQVDGSVAPARDDAGSMNPNGEMPSQNVDAPQAPQAEDGGNNPPPPMDGCQTGFHSCNGTCVDSKLPVNCGVACSPCPGITGGEPTCDGVKCSVQCPAGQKPCIDKCVAENAACEEKCPPGQNPCNGICVDRASISTCGTACVTCPTSPNGQTSCDGDKCVLACNTGYHACGNTCASNSDPLTCGTGCSPCPIPGGGSATCNGTQCGTTCPAKTKLCNGVCLEEGKPCGGTCPAGTHNCNDNCVSDKDTANCGTSCMPCQPPAKGQATCNGTTCGFTCQSGSHRCGEECKDNRSVDSCGTSSCSSCPTSASATATCDGSKCDLKCNGSLYLCNGVCQQCCNDGQCNGQGDKTGRCSIGSCQYACPTGTTDCGGNSCKSCCNDNACNGNLACVNGSCSSTQCRSGFKRCGNECITSATCCRADGCCANTDCGACEKCAAGKCVAQGANEDLKNECASETCKTGNCDGRGGCGVSPNNSQGPGCTTGERCEGTGLRKASSCQNGACQTGNLSACQAPANADPTCGGNACGFACKSGFTKDGSGCKVSCNSNQYLDGNTCQDKKGTEAVCRSSNECQSGSCLGEPSAGLRCCPPAQVSCGGFCVDFEGPPTCNPTGGAKTFCEVFADSNNCTINALTGQCGIYQTKILTYYEYTISRGAWLQKVSPKQKFYCCSTQQSATSASDPNCP